MRKEVETQRRRGNGEEEEYESMNGGGNGRVVGRHGRVCCTIVGGPGQAVQVLAFERTEEAPGQRGVVALDTSADPRLPAFSRG